MQYLHYQVQNILAIPKSSLNFKVCLVYCVLIFFRILYVYNISLYGHWKIYFFLYNTKMCLNNNA